MSFPVSVPGIRLVGDPSLRRRADPVEDPTSPELRRHINRLHALLDFFREKHGFGRAIAAPQIGVSLRVVAANLGSGPFTLINPRIVERSEETFTLWDDCMSFPELLVRVRRSASISLEYTTEEGRVVRRDDLGRADSELFQHELDHLDGVLALDHALEKSGLVHRAVYEADREAFEALVDGA